MIGFMNHLIHMTQGELFIKYWWLWLLIGTSGVMYKVRQDFKGGK